MRVVSGEPRGRRLRAPKGDRTRPTSDRVREALFSRLNALSGSTLEGAGVLDLYAGSGALAIEAISRGAAGATLVEQDRLALATIRANLEDLGLTGQARVIAGSCERIAERGPIPGAPFALLFLDPPYRINKSEVRGVVESLVRNGSLAGPALAIWEYATGDEPEWPSGFESLGTRTYGDTTVDIARWRGGSTG